MELVRIEGLPDDPLDAAARFHDRFLGPLRRPGSDALIVFTPADHTHRGWRLAAVQSLAREAVPFRVNSVASDDEAVISAARAYLENATGLTGQHLVLDGWGAGDVIDTAR